jgi:polysaccharide deacetylase family protein (PEP-CTERM system associated)
MIIENYFNKWKGENEQIDDVRRKLVLDLRYIHEACFWLDFRMLLASSVRLLGVPGIVVTRCLGLYRSAALATRHERSEDFADSRVRADQHLRRSIHKTSQEPWRRIKFLTDDDIESDSKRSRLSDDVPNAMTVDVEDYFQVSAFERHVLREDWEKYPCRVEANTERILSLLAAIGMRATFFVLGWIAERHPQLVRKIRQAGHEIGSHGYAHRLIYRQTPEEFRADIRRAAVILEDILGEHVMAYRAPSFSITAQSRWALEILVEEGFTVDSSVVPIYHDFCGMPGAKTGLHRLQTPAGGIWEFPPAILSLGKNINLPVGGGGYFRLYPLRFSTWCLKRLEGRQSFVFYIHPWEIDPDQPRLPAAWKSRFRHYRNLHSTLRKLERLLRTFHFGTMGEAIDRQWREQGSAMADAGLDARGEQVPSTCDYSYHG